MVLWYEGVEPELAGFQIQQQQHVKLPMAALGENRTQLLSRDLTFFAQTRTARRQQTCVHVLYKYSLFPGYIGNIMVLYWCKHKASTFELTVKDSAVLLFKSEHSKKAF